MRKKKKLLRKSRQSLEPFILSQVLWNSPQTTPESPLWNLCEGRRITTFECFSYFLDSIQISITLINVYWGTGCVQLGAKCGKGYQVELKLASAQRELTSQERSCRIPVDTFSTTRLQCSKANLHQTLREGYCNFQLELKAGSQRLNGQSSRDGCISRSQRFFCGREQTPDGEMQFSGPMQGCSSAEIVQYAGGVCNTFLLK